MQKFVTFVIFFQDMPLGLGMIDLVPSSKDTDENRCQQKILAGAVPSPPAKQKMPMEIDASKRSAGAVPSPPAKQKTPMEISAGKGYRLEQCPLPLQSKRYQ